MNEIEISVFEPKSEERLPAKTQVHLCITCKEAPAVTTEGECEDCDNKSSVIIRGYN